MVKHEAAPRPLHFTGVFSWRQHQTIMTFAAISRPVVSWRGRATVGRVGPLNSMRRFGAPMMKGRRSVTATAGMMRNATTKGNYTMTDDIDPYSPEAAALPVPQAEQAAPVDELPVWDDVGFACFTDDHWVQLHPVRLARGCGDLEPEHRPLFYALFMACVTAGGFVPDHPSATASMLGVSRQKWTAARKAMLDKQTVFRIKVRGRGGVIHLGMTEAYTLAMGSAGRSATGRANAERSKEIRDARRATGQATGQAVGQATGRANQYTNNQTSVGSRGFNPSGYDPEGRRVSLPGTQLGQATLPEFLAALCRDLGCDDSEARNSLNYPDWLHRLCISHGPKQIAAVVLALAEENAKTRFQVNTPVRYLSRKLPERLEQLGGKAPQSQADFDRDTRSVQIRLGLLNIKPGGVILGPLEKPNFFFLSEFKAGPGERGCKVPLDEVQAALGAVGYEWRDGAARPREAGQQPQSRA